MGQISTTESLGWCRIAPMFGSVLFAAVMDRLTDEVRQESPWTMLFAYDMAAIVNVVVVVVVVVCRGSREQVEETLDRWRYALGRGMDETKYIIIEGCI